MSGHDSRSLPPLAEPGTGAVVAAIDIGSNSIKMTVARLEAGGRIEEISRRVDVVRLGAGLEQTGRLADDRIEAALTALGRFAREAREHGASRLVAVATEAVRAAGNGPRFLERVRQETGIEVTVIDGEREAALSFRGLAATTDLSGEIIFADIGGGSTELIVARDGEMIEAGSVPLGSGRLSDRFVVADPPVADELARCRASALLALRPLHARIRAPVGGSTRLIVVGGTGEYLGRLVPDASHVARGDVANVLERLQRMTAAELAAALDVPEARARVLPAGITVVRALIELAEPAAIGIAQSGIRTGLLLETFAEMARTSAEGARS